MTDLATEQYQGSPREQIGRRDTEIKRAMYQLFQKTQHGLTGDDVTQASGLFREWMGGYDAGIDKAHLGEKAGEQTVSGWDLQKRGSILTDRLRELHTQVEGQLRADESAQRRWEDLIELCALEQAIAGKIHLRGIEVFLDGFMQTEMARAVAETVSGRIYARLAALKPETQIPM